MGRDFPSGITIIQLAIYSLSMPVFPSIVQWNGYCFIFKRIAMNSIKCVTKLSMTAVLTLISLQLNMQQKIVNKLETGGDLSYRMVGEVRMHWLEEATCITLRSLGEILRALQESLASELAARMNAMGNATDNVI
ncbi:hypothetical protein L6452_34629 [Arctium lappa]|uniref:Uncharacterized protein n=1 Tax=Arctium lappa TaxID=4217 RepID=A0ACB8YI35_ARCLA|nr:hypothetical protein L6452_34629 [Arctium lappa]